jgi:hypothetical protein
MGMNIGKKMRRVGEEYKYVYPSTDKYRMK